MPLCPDQCSRLLGPYTYFSRSWPVVGRWFVRQLTNVQVLTLLDYSTLRFRSVGSTRNRYDGLTALFSSFAQRRKPFQQTIRRYPCTTTLSNTNDRIVLYFVHRDRNRNTPSVSELFGSHSRIISDLLTTCLTTSPNFIPYF